MDLRPPRYRTRPMGYDSLSHLLNVAHKNSGGTTLDGATYTYDNAGNRLRSDIVFTTMTRVQIPSGSFLGNSRHKRRYSLAPSC